MITCALASASCVQTAVCGDRNAKADSMAIEKPAATSPTIHQWVSLDPRAHCRRLRKVGAGQARGSRNSTCSVWHGGTSGKIHGAKECRFLPVLDPMAHRTYLRCSPAVAMQPQISLNAPTDRIRYAGQLTGQSRAGKASCLSEMHMHISFSYGCCLTGLDRMNQARGLPASLRDSRHRLPPSPGSS